MTTATNVVPLSGVGHNRLEVIKHRIERGHERAVKGGAEWVEGSLEMATALREGRDAVPANLAFSAWLKQNKLDYWGKNDRAALIGLAGDLDVARVILTETKSRCYDSIWRAHRSRFPENRKTATGKRKRTHAPGRTQLFRAMKLGEDTLARIKGTSLDSAKEVDELIILNRGAPPGELTDVVKSLVEDAAAGKDVSAIAQGMSMGGATRARSVPALRAAWIKRMVTAWALAKPQDRLGLIEHLANSLDRTQRAELIDRLMKTI